MIIKKYLKQLSHKQKAVFILVCVIVFLVRYFHIYHYVNLMYLHQHMHMLHYFVNEFYILSVCCYMMSYILATTFSIPGSSIFTIAGGLLFGVWPGIFYILVSATSGATVLFLLSRYVIGDWVQRKYANQLHDFNQEIESYGHYYLLAVRLIALLPFCVVNMLSGLTVLRVKTFSLVTFIGSIPISFLYAYAGNQLSQLQSVDDLYTPSIKIALGVFIFFKVALVPVLVKMHKRFRFGIKKSRAPIVVEEIVPIKKHYDRAEL
jgi:uncharacterized membrane protein YdjX (TVP38/TMEM64 family)